MHVSAEKFGLKYKIPAKTSRGEYADKSLFVLRLEEAGQSMYGEIAPLPDLSIDGKEDITEVLPLLNDLLEHKTNPTEILVRLNLYPALQFALECCFLASKNKNRLLFDTPFTAGKESIRINGLIWMSQPEHMELAAIQKIKAGFGCIKFKVGANDHDEECRMLERIRKQFSAFKLEIRLDANGAFLPEHAGEILKDFSKFNVHSLEQPIQAGQWEQMQEVCAKSKVSIALDEELIGIDEVKMGQKLLDTIKPSYIVLKPTLLGGFTRCDHWIALAEKLGMGWWATSALESNLGLGHIAQWISTKNNPLHQGLGTGGLFERNFPSSTRLEGENMWFENPIMYTPKLV